MAKTKAVKKRPLSARKLAANRMNSKRSTGAKTTRGRNHSSMNRTTHGMRSAKAVLPWESQTEFDRCKNDLLETLDPRDGVEQMLADRVVMRNWYRIRGERATVARVEALVEEIIEGDETLGHAEVDRLAPLINGDPAPIRRLRSFPAGVSYLRAQWAILKARLAKGRNLLGTQRDRCFALLGKPRECVLHDDEVGGKWMRAQIGVLLGPDASLTDVASFLADKPPPGMSPAEFEIRVGIMSRSLESREVSFGRLQDLIVDQLRELDALQVYVDAVAARRLQNKALGATVETTPDGARLSNYILANERGCDAALRRIESGRKPNRPGPGPAGDRKKSRETGAAPGSDSQVPVSPAGPAPEPMPTPEPLPTAAVVAKAQAAGVQAGVGSSEATPGEVEPTETNSTYEPTEVEPTETNSTYEPTEVELTETNSTYEPTEVELTETNSTYEPTEAGTTADPEPSSEAVTYDDQADAAPAEARPAEPSSTYEATEAGPQGAPGRSWWDTPTPLDDDLEEGDLERYAPELNQLRELFRPIESTYGTRGRIDAPAGPERASNGPLESSSPDRCDSS